MGAGQGPSIPTMGRARSALAVACAGAALAVMQPASAQDSSRADAILDLPAAAREAIAWHPTVVRATEQLNAQEQRIDEVRSARYPQVSGGVGLGYDSTLRNDWRPSANIGVSQRLLDFGKLDSLTDIERSGVRVARAQVLLSVDSLLQDTAFSVIEILRGEMLHAAAAEQVERVRAVGNLVDARFARGAATRSDALQTQSRVDAAQSTIQQIKAELLRWQTNLAFLVGRDVAPPVSSVLPEAFASACAANLETLDAPPLMQEARARLEQAEARLRNEKVSRMPTISLAGTGRSDLLDPLGEDRARYDFGVRVESSLFDGGAYRSRVRGAQLAQAAAAADFAAARLESTRTFAEARAQESALEDRAATLGQRYTTMERTRELYRLQYLELGTRTLVDLLNADQELSQIRFDEINARYDLARLAVVCLHSGGRLREVLGLGGEDLRGVRL